VAVDAGVSGSRLPIHGRTHKLGGSDPIGDEVIANTQFFWANTGDADNPAVLCDHPCTIVAYIVDCSANGSNVHVAIIDSADGGSTTGTGATGIAPGPAALGANTLYTLSLSKGLTIEVVDDTATPIDTSGTATVYVTVAVYDPTL